jgi:hypothetical protein
MADETKRTRAIRIERAANYSSFTVRPVWPGATEGPATLAVAEVPQSLHAQALLHGLAQYVSDQGALGAKATPAERYAEMVKAMATLRSGQWATARQAGPTDPFAAGWARLVAEKPALAEKILAQLGLAKPSGISLDNRAAIARALPAYFAPAGQPQPKVKIPTE